MKRKTFKPIGLNLNFYSKRLAPAYEELSWDFTPYGIRRQRDWQLAHDGH